MFGNNLVLEDIDKLYFISIDNTVLQLELLLRLSG